MSNMHPLGRLITQRMEHPDNGWSLNAVVKRAESRGEKLGRANLGNIKNEMTPQISRATIYGIAAGLGVTPLTVANAALESWGINPHPAEVTDCIETIRVDPTLGEHHRRQLIALVTEMRRESSDDPENGAPARVDTATTAAAVSELEVDGADDNRHETG